MARIRQIKPQFFVDEDVAKLSPLARLMFIGLWTIADKHGRLEDKPRTIKVVTLPFDECDAEVLLGELVGAAMVIRYEVAGKKCIQIKSFEKHQKPHPKEPSSDLPEQAVKKHGEPRRNTARTGNPGTSSADSGVLVLGSGGSDSGGSLEPPASKPNPATPPVFVFPCVGDGAKTWDLTDSQQSEWVGLFPGVNVPNEVRAAFAWIKANPTRRKTASGMPSFIAKWLTRSQNSGGASPLARAGPAAKSDGNVDALGNWLEKGAANG